MRHSLTIALVLPFLAACLPTPQGTGPAPVLPAPDASVPSAGGPSAGVEIPTPVLPELPYEIVVVDSCKGLPKQVVCGVNGVNYYNPCSAHNSAVNQYAVVPCRKVGETCSQNTSSCIRGSQCVSGVCVK